MKLQYINKCITYITYQIQTRYINLKAPLEMLFADDLVLISELVEYLQQKLNYSNYDFKALECSGIQISRTKT